MYKHCDTKSPDKRSVARTLQSGQKQFWTAFRFCIETDGTGKAVFRGGYGIFYDLAVVGNDLFFVRKRPTFQKPETFDAGTLPGDLTLSDRSGPHA